jgi:hypothetical protein
MHVFICAWVALCKYKSFLLVHVYYRCYDRKSIHTQDVHVCNVYVAVRMCAMNTFGPGLALLIQRIKQSIFLFRKQKVRNHKLLSKFSPTIRLDMYEKKHRHACCVCICKMASLLQYCTPLLSCLCAIHLPVILIAVAAVAFLNPRHRGK